MCNKRQKRMVYNLNRYLICCLIIVGCVVDGINISDAFFVVATLLWVFLPECHKREVKFIDRLVSVIGITKKL